MNTENEKKIFKVNSIQSYRGGHMESVWLIKVLAPQIPTVSTYSPQMFSDFTFFRFLVKYTCNLG